jgi:hypothetical protein
VTICIVDTSAFCNVLDVPGKNQRRDDARAALRNFIDDNADLLLPLAAVYETGRHIAQLADGRVRRASAESFVKQVGLALRGDAPWAPTPLPSAPDLADWLVEFPEAATAGKSLADLSMIKLWEDQCRRFEHRRVLIWTYDRTDLGAYDRAGRIHVRSRPFQR